MSFSPFLGGRRVCIGKTLAENIGKIVIAVFMTQVEFEFVDPKVKDDKPASTFLHEQPTYRMFINALE